MNDGRVARVEPAVAHRLRGGFRIVVVAFHHDVAAHHYFPDRVSIVEAAGGAPAVKTRTALGADRRISSSALARPISTVGAAQSIVMRSFLISSKTKRESTFRRHTCAAPAAVTVQTNVQPFA